MGALSVKLFLVAGEASGDKLGAALMAALIDLVPGVTFAGIGGPQMEALGLKSLFPMEELSVMGILEVLPKYRQLKRRIAETAEAVLETAPDALITIDSPDFCLRVARIVKAARPAQKTVHYVAPSVWAWRPGRAAKMAEVIDHVLALLPFEPPYMTAAGMSCDFVGHPVVAEPRAPKAEATALRQTLMIGADQPVLLCLPGSRRGEVKRLMPRFAATVAALRRDLPGLRVLIPTVRGVAPLVRKMACNWDEVPNVISDPAEKRAAFATANLALAASGTVSLELAANRVPMVIGYRMNWLSWHITKRAMLIDTVTLVNLVSETRAVPEFLGPACRARPMARALQDLWQDPQRRATQVSAMETTMLRLGEGGAAPGLRAARSVLAFLQRG